MSPLEQQLAILAAQGIVERGGGPLGIYWQDGNGNGDNFYLDPFAAHAAGITLPYPDFDGITYKALPDSSPNAEAYLRTIGKWKD